MTICFRRIVVIPFLLHHLVLADSWEVHSGSERLELEIWIAGQRMGLVLFRALEPVVHLASESGNSRISNRSGSCSACHTSHS